MQQDPPRHRWFKRLAVFAAATLLVVALLLTGLWMALPQWVERLATAALFDLGFEEAEVHVAGVGPRGLTIQSVRAVAPHLSVTAEDIGLTYRWPDLRKRELTGVTVRSWEITATAEELPPWGDPAWAWPLALLETDGDPKGGVRHLSLPRGRISLTVGEDRWSAEIRAEATLPAEGLREWQLSVEGDGLRMDGSGIQDAATGELEVTLSIESPDPGPWLNPLQRHLPELAGNAWMETRDWQTRLLIGRDGKGYLLGGIDYSFARLHVIPANADRVVLRHGRGNGRLNWDSASDWETADITFESDITAVTWSGIQLTDTDLTWRGTPSAGEVTLSANLPEIANRLLVEQRLVREETGWRATGAATLPRGRVSGLAVVEPFLTAVPGLTGSGWLSAKVENDFRLDEPPRFTGEIHLEDFTLRDAENRRADGVSLPLGFVFSAGEFRTGSPARLEFDTLSVGDWTAGPGRVQFTFHLPESVRVESARINWAGGVLSADPFAFRPAQPEFTVTLDASGVELGQLLAMVPDLSGRGEGILDGRLRLRAAPERLQIETGLLRLRGDNGRLRLPNRSWFSAGMSPGNIAHDQVTTVERALENLLLKQFRLDFLAEEEPGVPLRITLEGQPLDQTIRVPSINLTINVHGPVRELANWALGPDMRIAPR